MSEANIKVKIMNRLGHSEETVDFERATELVKEEMAKGKWLRLVDEDGNRYIESRVELAVSRLEEMKARLPDFRSVMLMAAVAGGAPSGMIEINGKFFPAGDVTIKVGGKDIRISDLENPEDEADDDAGDIAPENTVDLVTRIVTKADDDNIVSVFRNDDGEITVEINNAYGKDEALEAFAALANTAENYLADIVDGIKKDDILEESGE